MRVTFGVGLIILRLFLMCGTSFSQYIELQQGARFAGLLPLGFLAGFAGFSLVAAMGLLLRSRAAPLLAMVLFSVDAVITLAIGITDPVQAGALLVDVLAVIYLLYRYRLRSSL
jgi:hypothetical protein